MNSSSPDALTSQDRAQAGRVRVWDLPTRLFHWVLLTCVAGLFATAYAPGNWIEWHARLGYALLALLLFRVVWGFVGGHWSRFVQFLPWAGQGLRLGHSVSGALAVVVMLAALFAQVATGLVGDDEIAFTGPLNRFISTDLGLAATAWHKSRGQWILVGLIALHVAAILFYRWVRRNDLIGSMWSGDKAVDVAVPAGRDGDPLAVAAVVASADTLSTRLRALAVLALCAGAVALLVQMASLS